jgi:uncharacterized membrane protein YqaE (UPF0057 family)
MTDGNDNAAVDVLLIVLALFIPPLAVFLKAEPHEKCGGHFWLNILLCLFMWIPGILHAIWFVVAK